MLHARAACRLILLWQSGLGAAGGRTGLKAGRAQRRRPGRLPRGPRRGRGSARPAGRRRAGSGDGRGPAPRGRSGSGAEAAAEAGPAAAERAARRRRWRRRQRAGGGPSPDAPGRPETPTAPGRWRPRPSHRACAATTATVAGLTALRTDIGARRLLSTPGNGTRLARDAKTGEFLMLLENGNVRRIDLQPDGTATSAALYSPAQIGMPAGSSAHGMSLGPDGTLYVVSHLSQSASGNTSRASIWKGVRGSRRRADLEQAGRDRQLPAQPDLLRPRMERDRRLARRPAPVRQRRLAHRPRRRPDQRGRFPRRPRGGPHLRDLPAAHQRQQPPAAQRRRRPPRRWGSCSRAACATASIWSSPPTATCWPATTVPTPTTTRSSTGSARATTTAFPGGSATRTTRCSSPTTTPPPTAACSGARASPPSTAAAGATTPPSPPGRPASPSPSRSSTPAPTATATATRPAGAIEDASATGKPFATFTDHGSPLGLTFDRNEGALCADLAGGTFILRFGKAAGATYDDPGRDLLHLRLTKTGNDYAPAPTTQLVRGFSGPVDAVLVADKMYVLDRNLAGSGQGTLWEVTLPSGR